MLAKMLLVEQKQVWQENGIQFAKQADIYHLHERAVDKIESFMRVT